MPLPGHAADARRHQRRHTLETDCVRRPPAQPRAARGVRRGAASSSSSSSDKAVSLFKRRERYIGVAMMRHPLVLLLLTALAAPAAAQMDYQPPPDLEPLHRPYDQLLDTYARDGIIYYRALRLRSRQAGSLCGVARLTAVASRPPILGQAAADRVLDQRLQRDRRFRRRSVTIPAAIRQMPGAFDQLKHTVAGQSVTLD